MKSFRVLLGGDHAGTGVGIKEGGRDSLIQCLVRPNGILHSRHRFLAVPRLFGHGISVFQFRQELVDLRRERLESLLQRLQPGEHFPGGRPFRYLMSVVLVLVGVGRSRRSLLLLFGRREIGCLRFRRGGRRPRGVPLPHAPSVSRSVRRRRRRRPLALAGAFRASPRVQTSGVVRQAHAELGVPPGGARVAGAVVAVRHGRVSSDMIGRGRILRAGVAVVFFLLLLLVLLLGREYFLVLHPRLELPPRQHPNGQRRCLGALAARPDVVAGGRRSAFIRSDDVVEPGTLPAEGLPLRGEIFQLSLDLPSAS
mmetsp:Transcript_8251/g.17823  ORF Transcript_8251/g.17823 Transcript_8251/m.17823 type:complete len:311 (-) Transcript_8251:26-958(-)